MRIQECGASAIALADEVDRPPLKFECSRCRPRAASQLRGPGTELGELQLHELSRVRHVIPEHERPLEMGVSLRESEDGLRLACGVDRRGERLCAATRRLPVLRELRRGRSSATRELFGQLRVKLLALAGEDRRVDRLGEQGVAEAEAAGCLVGDENALLDRLSKRLANVLLRARSERAQQRVAHVTSGGRGQTQEALRLGSSRPMRWSNRSRRRRGSSTLSSPAAARSSSAKNGLPSDRETMAFVTAPGSTPSAWAASSAASSSSSSGPSSSTTPEPERRMPSATRRTRSADPGSSARYVASSRTWRPPRLCAR